MLPDLHRPDLQPAIIALLTQLGPSIRNGGSVPLTALVGAVVGDKLKDDVRRKLDARGDALFRAGHEATFFNEGQSERIELKRFTIVLPPRIAGRARLIGPDGAELGFDEHASLSAAKFLLSVRLVRVRMTRNEVLVAKQSDLTAPVAYPELRRLQDAKGQQHHDADLPPGTTRQAENYSQQQQENGGKD